MQKSTINDRKGRAGYAVKALLGGVSVAVLLSVGSVAAQAEDSVTIKEIKELKAHLRQLEKRLDAQSKATSAVLRREAAYPVTKGPYEPPFGWDKKFHLYGLTITPGGYLALDGVYRSRYEGSDLGEAFGSLPEYNSSTAHMNELRFTARTSRISALIEGAINPTTSASGYIEMDFLGAGVTANSNETNAYSPRVRQAYLTVDWKDIGLHVLAGQAWSLATLQGEGFAPRNEVIPTTIDTQYVVGFNFTRTPGIRLIKNFDNGFTAAVAAELPSTTGCPTPTVTAGLPNTTSSLAVEGTTGITCAVAGTSGTNLNDTTTYSVNHIPDVIAKAGWDGVVGGRKLHVEGYGIYADLYDQVSTAAGAPSGLYYSNVRYDTAGWGAGGGLTFQVLPKWVDLDGTALIGRGVGRYGAGQLSDVEVGPNGQLISLPEIQWRAGLTVHATPQLDLYAYGGEERILNADYNPANLTNYSVASANNSGCDIVGGTCAGATENLWEITGGLWDKVYDGAFGSVRVGFQYAYIERQLFPGTGTSSGLPAYSGSPSFNEQEAYASLRYYPFDAPPPAPPLVSKY